MLIWSLPSASSSDREASADLASPGNREVVYSWKVTFRTKQQMSLMMLLPYKFVPHVGVIEGRKLKWEALGRTYRLRSFNRTQTMYKIRILKHTDTQTIPSTARIGRTHRWQGEHKSVRKWVGGQSHREQGDFISPVPKQKEIRGFSPQANYTDRATAACQRS
jgi:hypothetical protein